jgi:transcription elongation GreA/GreB family factor
MKIIDDDGEIVVITPGSPLGSRLLGLRSGDEVRVGEDTSVMQFTIAEVC